MSENPLPTNEAPASPAGSTGQGFPSDDAWAKPVSKIEVANVPEGVNPMNVEGRQVIGALQGFGQLWKKTYKVRLSGVKLTPAEIMKVWKENFPRFQPAGSIFYPTMEGVKPGEMLYIDSPLPPAPGMPGIIPMKSGVMVLYSDDVSFGVMTPEGFPVAGWNNFTVFEEDSSPVAQVQSWERASDPIYEFGFRFMGGAARQESIWYHVLTKLAEYYGVKGQVTKVRECLDPSMQWSEAGRIWRNAGVRTTIYTLGAPIRWVNQKFRRQA